MRHFKLNKLVRDGVFDFMVAQQDPEYRILEDKEFRQALKAKILEEANELDTESPEALEELADTLEATEQLAKELGAGFEKLRAEQLKKRKKRGAFNKRAFISTLHLQDDDPWVEYYAKDPKRFPEEK